MVIRSDFGLVFATCHSGLDICLSFVNVCIIREAQKRMTSDSYLAVCSLHAEPAPDDGEECEAGRSLDRCVLRNGGQRLANEVEERMQARRMVRRSGNA